MANRAIQEAQRQLEQEVLHLPTTGTDRSHVDGLVFDASDPKPGGAVAAAAQEKVVQKLMALQPGQPVDRTEIDGLVY